jgi:hypothetical protein
MYENWTFSSSSMENLIVKMTKCRKQYVRFKIQWVYGVFSTGISTFRQPILERSNQYTHSVPSKNSSSLYYTMANFSCIVVFITTRSFLSLFYFRKKLFAIGSLLVEFPNACTLFAHTKLFLQKFGCLKS